MKVLRWLVAVYGRLLRLYPAAFRAQFEEEMRLTFADALDGAADGGILSMLTTICRELRHLPASLLRQYLIALRRKEANMGAPVLPHQSHSVQQQFDRPASWLAAGVGAAAFLIPVLRWSLVETPLARLLSQHLFANTARSDQFLGINAPSWLPYVETAGLLYFGLTFLPALVFGIAWLRGFPRWSYPYTALMLLYGLGLMNSNSWGYLHWGWRAWLPALIAALIGLLVTRSFEPVRRLVANARQDWTLITWSLFTLFAGAILIGLDDPRTGTDQWRAPLQTYIVLTLAAVGLALVYLRCSTGGRRAAVLLAGISAIFALTIVTPALTTGFGVFSLLGLVMLPIILAALFLPGLLAAARSRV